MPKLFLHLANDEAGFVVSSELILISTIVVISLIVGLAEVSNGVNQELEDVGAAFGAVNQSFCYHGLTGHKGWIAGSCFGDHVDKCDGQDDISCNDPPQPEALKHQGW